MTQKQTASCTRRCSTRGGAVAELLITQQEETVFTWGAQSTDRDAACGRSARRAAGSGTCHRDRRRSASSGTPAPWDPSSACGPGEPAGENLTVLSSLTLSPTCCSISVLTVYYLLPHLTDVEILICAWICILLGCNNSIPINLISEIASTICNTKISNTTHTYLTAAYLVLKSWMERDFKPCREL